MPTCSFDVPSRGITLEAFLRVETLFIELLLVVSLVALAVRRLRVPYTVALVIVGLLLTVGEQPNTELTPELVLALFLPPLVFEAAFHLSFDALRRMLPSILLLAVPGVVITTVIVGAIVTLTTSIPLEYALVFGALIAATDPVAVVATFRSISVPKRLAVLVEGESLLNDGTAIVVFNVVLASALAGSISVASGAVDFLRVALGGVTIGFVFGWIVSQAIARVDDYLIETTLTTVLAFGSYLLAERLHVSGVLAVVVAGLINGNVGPRGMSPTTRIVLFNFWEYVAFLANSLVFLLIGLRVHVPSLVESWHPIAWSIAAVLVARVVVVYGLSWVANHVGEPVPTRWQHVLAWGGLRGAVSLALALSLPIDLGPARDQILIMAFGVVLFTLLVQATTIGRLLRRIGVGVGRSEATIAYETAHARLTAAVHARNHLQALERGGLISGATVDDLRAEYDTRTSAYAAEVRQLLRENPDLAGEERDTARREALRAERGVLLELRRDGIILEPVFERLAGEIDRALQVEDLESELASESKRAGPEPAG